MFKMAKRFRGLSGKVVVDERLDKISFKNFDHFFAYKVDQKYYLSHAIR